MQGYKFADREIERVAVFLDNDLLIFSFVLPPPPSIIYPTQAPVLVWAKICHVALIYTAILQAYPQNSLYVHNSLVQCKCPGCDTMCPPPPTAPLKQIPAMSDCHTAHTECQNLR